MSPNSGLHNGPYPCRTLHAESCTHTLRRLGQSITVAEWQTHLTDTLPDDLRGSLLTIKKIEAEWSGDLKKNGSDYDELQVRN